MDRREQWMKDPELKAAYEALGPNFRREVELAQQRRGIAPRTGRAVSQPVVSHRPRPHTTATARR